MKRKSNIVQQEKTKFNLYEVSYIKSISPRVERIVKDLRFILSQSGWIAYLNKQGINTTFYKHTQVTFREFSFLQDSISKYLENSNRKVNQAFLFHWMGKVKYDNEK